jgi:hypothetical protein
MEFDFCSQCDCTYKIILREFIGFSSYLKWRYIYQYLMGAVESYSD